MKKLAKLFNHVELVRSVKIYFSLSVNPVNFACSVGSQKYSEGSTLRFPAMVAVAAGGGGTSGVVG